MTRTADSSEAMEHIGARASQSLIDRLDAMAAKLSTPWHKAKRSEVMRAALERGLDALEAEASTPPS